MRPLGRLLLLLGGLGLSSPAALTFFNRIYYLSPGCKGLAYQMDSSTWSDCTDGACTDTSGVSSRYCTVSTAAPAPPAKWLVPPYTVEYHHSDDTCSSASFLEAWKTDLCYVVPGGSFHYACNDTTYTYSSYSDDACTDQTYGYTGSLSCELLSTEAYQSHECVVV
eukprot:TRINITY_DN6725_c0_g1_i1.p1 TRINITY_DN6725_c0_g1~~TRINITY_DN6725_c0_g1_i1.p1  ORF type:complete len:166 (-),score=41.17 TRINITY_DN6725_c0_g1_i1:45-542(-)